LGWYTKPQGGTKLVATTRVSAGAELYAHWQANNTLKSLKISKGKWNKSFAPTKFSGYRITLNKAQASLKLTAAKIAKGAKIQTKVGKARWQTKQKLTLRVKRKKSVSLAVKVSYPGLQAKTYKLTIIRK
jgi:hypothetical protein